jgi:archaellum biogenesis ATPase FlaH/5S rRNA maturation endonuclease (ribonuclease M5)
MSNIKPNLTRDKLKRKILALTKMGLNIFLFFQPNLKIRGNRSSSVLNPFYHDTRESLSIYQKNSVWYFNDFGDPTYKGDCFDFAKLSYKKNGLDLSFDEVLQRIIKDMGIDISRNVPVIIDIPEVSEPHLNKTEAKSSFELFEQEFTCNDLKFWEQYGIKENLLKTNNVISLKGYKFGSGKKFFKSEVQLLFGYKHNGFYKIYQPYSDDYKFLYLGNKNPNSYFGSYIPDGPMEKEIFIITGGEKDCLTLQSLGYQAICLNSESAELSTELRDQLYWSNQEIVILYDIDETGLKCSNKIASSNGYRNVILPEALKHKGGKDVSDWIRLGLSIQKLKNLIEGREQLIVELPEIEAEPIEENYLESDRSKKKDVLTGEDLLNQKIEEIPTLLNPLFPLTGLIALGGSSDTGKSAFLRQFAIAICNKETDFLGFTINARYHSVIYVSTEDDEYATGYLLRLQEKNKNYGAAAYKSLKYIFDSDRLLQKLENELSENPADVVIIDAYADIFTGELNQVNKVRSFLNDFSNLAHKYNCLFIFLHHTGKNAEEKIPSKNNLLGSQGFEAKMRLVIELRKDLNNPNLRHLCIVKGNYLKSDFKNQSFVLEFSDMLFKKTGQRESFESLVVCNAKSITLSEEADLVKKLKKEGLTTREIAEKTGISKSKVDRLLKS